MATADDIAAALVAGLDPVIDRLKALERRLAEVEARGMQFRGVYQRAESYRRGDVTTFDGSAWVALDQTRTAPGSDGSWALMAKKGRDAR